MMFKYTLSVAFASAFALGTFISSTGCAVDTTTGTVEVDLSTDGGLPDAPIEPTDHCLNGQPDEGEMGVDCGGTCDGCAGGATCVVDSDCSSGLCVDQIGVDLGSCYGPDLDGCIDAAVSPTIGLCSTVENRLLVCAPAYPTDTLGSCKNVGTGEHGEVYLCCAR